MRTTGLKILLFTAIILWGGYGYVSFARRYFAPTDTVQQVTALLVSTTDPATETCKERREGIAQPRTQHVCKVLFSPDDNIRKVLVALIDAEKEALSIAIFSLTDQQIVKSLLRAHKRGIAIQVVADRTNAANQWNKVHQLAKAGIPVHLYPINEHQETYSIMHHKFALFTTTIDNRPLLLTGSYNFTNSASESNQENVIILEDPAVIKQYRAQFDRLKTRAKLTTAEAMRPRRFNRPRPTRKD